MRVKDWILGLVCLAVASASIPAGASNAEPFIGEWAVTLSGTGSTFEACWLKVYPKGDGIDMQMLWRWGSVTPVKSAKVVDGELQWVRSEYWESEDKNVDIQYQAKLVGGTLVGWVKKPWMEKNTFVGVPSIDYVDIEGAWVGGPDGSSDYTLKLTRHGPIIRGELSDGYDSVMIQNAKLEGNKLTFKVALEENVTCEATFKGDLVEGKYDAQSESGDFTLKRQRQMGEKIVLFDGKSLDNFHSRNVDKAKPAWKIENGWANPVPGQGSDIISDQRFRDFKLRVNYMFPKDNGNSGVYVRGRYEVQLLNDYGRGVETHGAGAIYSRISPTRNVTKPTGTPQVMEVTLIGQYITVVHNGTTVIDNAYIEGITGGALDACENLPGPVVLQAHGEEVKFGVVEIWPLEKK